MIATGPTLGYVYKGEMNGFTEEGLHEARDMLREDIPEAEAMEEALSRVIEGPVGIGMVRELRAEGKVLMAATTSLSQAAPEGLMYVEGEPIEADPLTVVRVGLWIVRSGQRGPFANTTMYDEQRDRIRDMFLDSGLRDVAEHGDDALQWGIPVSRETKVVPLHPQEGDIQEEFVYGHRKDLLAVAGLEVPDALKAQITDLVQDYHRTEN
ncbi:MAG: hypothetical protein QG628_10 [Patescibacteria group bacterium]|nr:hypothetical protein [Patescibacteria group bacterium]